MYMDNNHVLKSPLAMAEWIEIMLASSAALQSLSPLAMAEWIEILLLIEVS